MIISDKNKIGAKPKILVHFHLYYHNQLHFVLKKLRNICDCEWNLVVTACEISDNIINKIKAFKPDAKIILVENKGYDIWPFIQVLNETNLSDYDFVLKIHTKNYRKKFGYFGYGYSWRNFLIDGVLKNKKRFTENLQLLLQNPDIGMIASEAVIVPMGYKFSEDNNLFYQICSKYNIPANRGDFVAGTMFIARTECFEPIKNIKFTQEDFSHEQITDGKQTVTHVLERLLSRVVEINNYKIYPVPSKKYKIYKAFKEILKNIFAIRNEVTETTKRKYICILGCKYYSREKKLY